MIYYVIFDPNNGNFYGLTTFSTVSFPDNYIIEERTGDLPKSIDLWDNNIKNFVVEPKRIVSKLEFLNSFTMQERISIRTNATTNPIISDIMQLLEIAEFVNKDDPNTVNSIQYLASVGIIEQSRVNVILGD